MLVGEPVSHCSIQETGQLMGQVIHIHVHIIGRQLYPHSRARWGMKYCGSNSARTATSTVDMIIDGIDEPVTLRTTIGIDSLHATEQIIIEPVISVRSRVDEGRTAGIQRNQPVWRLIRSTTNACFLKQLENNNHCPCLDERQTAADPSQFYSKLGVW